MVDNDQLLVAQNTESALCIALAGSGKTKTLIDLTKNLVQMKSKPRCYVLTFTRAAAAELRERLAAFLTAEEFQKVVVSTFDAVFKAQYESSSKGKRKKETLTGATQYNFVERVLRTMPNIDGKVEKVKVVDAISWIDEYGRMLEPKSNPKLPHFSLDIFNAYSELRVKNNKQDFNSVTRDVILGVISGSIEPLDTEYMLLDEYQDSSAMQYEWVLAHGEAGIKVVSVGDDDQSIYSWRGANSFDNMVRFQKDFNAKAYLLKTCYRCRPEILEAAKKVIEFNTKRIAKTMRSGKEAGGKVDVRGYDTTHAELNGIVDTITANPKGWAILARNNLDLDRIETELKLFNIAYERKGGKNFWDNQIANLILKVLWSLTHPKNNKYMAEILAFIYEDENIISLLNKKLNTATFSDLVPTRDVEWSTHTETLQSHWWEWGANESNKELIADKLVAIGALLKSARKGKNDKLIDIVIDAIVNINLKGDYHSRIKFLCGQLSPAKDKSDENDTEDKVLLSTFHSSKGLQWPKVWLYGSVQGKCPSKTAIANDGIEEERRLYYVGMTRAEDELYMSYHRIDDNSKSVQPSQFLTEAFPERF